MKRHLIPALGLLLAMGGLAEARTTISEAEMHARPARLVLVDEATHAGMDAGDWRLQTERFAPPTEDEDAFRVKVKVRPNRAMGRMSLSF